MLQAMAAHNSGGVVIVQVERIVDRGTMNTRAAYIPGALVDKIVLAPAEHHWMHLGSSLYDGSLSGQPMEHQCSWCLVAVIQLFVPCSMQLCMTLCKGRRSML